MTKAITIATVLVMIKSPVLIFVPLVPLSIVQATITINSSSTITTQSIIFSIISILTGNVINSYAIS